MKILLDKRCPECQNQTIQLDDNAILCTRCDFKRLYTCPYCNGTLASHATALQCQACQQVISPRKIANMIDHNLCVSHTHRCRNCNAVTLYPDTAPNAYRCLKFPQCIGQASLFDAPEPESLVFLDFETTGLDMSADDVIEIGAVKLDKDGYLHTLQILVETQRPLSDTIQRLTGITPDIMQDAKPASVAFADLAVFMQASTVIAHNANFDIPWLLIMGAVHGVSIPDFPVVCTLEWAKANHEARCNLGVLAKKYGIHNPQAHRALADALTTHALYFCFKNAAKPEAPRQSSAQYATLVTRYTSQRSG